MGWPGTRLVGVVSRADRRIRSDFFVVRVPAMIPRKDSCATLDLCFLGFLLPHHRDQVDRDKLLPTS